MKLNNTGVGNAGEGHITIDPRSYSSIGQGTWAEDTDTHFPYNGLTNTSDTQNDQIQYLVYLAAGIYTLRVTYLEISLGGICAAQMISALGTKDMYAGAQATAVWTITGITVGIPGLYILYFTMSDKNPLSAGYQLHVKKIALWRTA